MKTITVKRAAENWSVSERWVQTCCAKGEIKGAIKESGVWRIPEDALRPVRTPSGKRGNRVITPLNVLSLFSGCGGMDLGFEGGFRVLNTSVNPKINPHWRVRREGERWTYLPQTRFHTVFANDILPYARRAWTEYFCQRFGIPKMSYHETSIVDLVKLQETNGHSMFPEGVDIVTGGFPCQDFSISGKRKGFDSDTGHDGKRRGDDVPSIESRGQLYMWMREVISLTQPKLFIAENVKGLTNLKDVKEVIETDFASVCNGGYIVVPARVLLAANYGVPQSRERVIFYGFKRSALRTEALKALTQSVIDTEYDPYPVPTHQDTVTNKEHLLPFVTLKDVFSDLPEPEEATDIDQKKYSKAKYMGKHCQGQTEINLDGIGPTIRSEHHGNIEYRRLSVEHGGKCTKELAEGKKERRLTIRECARIQTFPDNYRFVTSARKGEPGVSASEAYKLIGNAVPPLLAYHIAKRIEDNWDKYFR